MNGRICNLISAWLIFGLSATPCLAGTAYLYPEAIFEGDIAELVIEYDSKIPSLYALDTAPLKKDFEVLDSRSRVIRLEDTNSNRHRMQWRLQLLPRNSGRLTVPALAFGNQSSPPLILEVKPVTDSMRTGQDVFLELEADPEKPYVGQQTLVTLRLFHNTPIRIDGLAEPDIAEATLFHERDESVYFVDRDGSQFRVLERHIDLFPNATGPLELPPATFRGELREPAAIEPNLPGRKISRRSEALLLEVREPPPEHTGRFWLPAREIEIAHRLEAHDTELEVGDSVDWVLTLVARGLPAESLPANLLEFESENYTVYADQAMRGNRFEGGDLTGRLEQRFAIIITGPGPVDLPEITLDWWDLTADTGRRATIEAERIGIARFAARGGSGHVDGESSIEMFFSPEEGKSNWPWLAGLLALLGLVMASARPWRQLFASRLEPILRRRRIRLLLRRACLDNHAARARASVIEWGRVRWPGNPTIGLFAIGERTDNPELREELARLDAVLFASRETRWQGKRLWQLIAAEDRRVARGGRSAESRSPALYPG